MPAGEIPPATPIDLPGDYANSIGRTLWLDAYVDIESDIIGGDGIRQPEEAPLGG